MKNILESTLVVLVLFVVVTSCKRSDPEPPIVYDTAELLTRSYLTSAAGYDWLINGDKLGPTLPYLAGSKHPFQWDTNLSEVLLSINDNDTGNEILNITLPVQKDKSYYSMLVGTVSSITMVYGQNDTTPPATGNVRLRFLHAYQDVGPIDIYVGGTTADHKKATNLDYSKLSTYIEVSVADANSVIVCTNTGIAPNVDTNLLTIGANVAHNAGKIYEHGLASKTIDPTSVFTLVVFEQ